MSAIEWVRQLYREKLQRGGNEYVSDMCAHCRKGFDFYDDNDFLQGDDFFNPMNGWTDKILPEDLAATRDEYWDSPDRIKRFNCPYCGGMLEGELTRDGEFYTRALYVQSEPATYPKNQLRIFKR